MAQPLQWGFRVGPTAPLRNQRLSLQTARLLSQAPAVLALAVAAYDRFYAPGSDHTFLFGSAAVVLAMLGAHCMLGRHVDRRLGLLIEDAGRLARGETPEPRPVGAPDALGALESAFRGLAEHVRARDAARRAEAQRQHTDAQIYKAVSMADTEEDVVEVAGRALARVVPDHPAEILLADSRGTQLHLAAVSATGLSPGCPVESPSGCAAFRRGQTLRFGRSDDLDACPRLRDRPEGVCSAVCMPVNVMGRAIGVVHVTASVTEPPTDEAVAALESVSTHVGARLAMLDSLQKADKAMYMAKHAGLDRLVVAGDQDAVSAARSEPPARRSAPPGGRKSIPPGGGPAAPLVS